VVEILEGNLVLTKVVFPDQEDVLEKADQAENLLKSTANSAPDVNGAGLSLLGFLMEQNGYGNLELDEESVSTALLAPPPPSPPLGPGTVPAPLPSAEISFSISFPQLDADKLASDADYRSDFEQRYISGMAKVLGEEADVEVVDILEGKVVVTRVTFPPQENVLEKAREAEELLKSTAGSEIDQAGTGLSSFGYDMYMNGYGSLELDEDSISTALLAPPAPPPPPPRPATPVPTLPWAEISFRISFPKLDVDKLGSDQDYRVDFEQRYIIAMLEALGKEATVEVVDIVQGNVVVTKVTLPPQVGVSEKASQTEELLKSTADSEVGPAGTGLSLLGLRMAQHGYGRGELDEESISIAIIAPAPSPPPPPPYLAPDTTPLLLPSANITFDISFPQLDADKLANDTEYRDAFEQSYIADMTEALGEDAVVEVVDIEGNVVATKVSFPPQEDELEKALQAKDLLESTADSAPDSNGTGLSLFGFLMDQRGYGSVDLDVDSIVIIRPVGPASVPPPATPTRPLAGTPPPSSSPCRCQLECWLLWRWESPTCFIDGSMGGSQC